jgi:hypothetical protein
MGKRTAGSDAPEKKDRARGWAQSTFFANDLKKLRTTGLLSPATVIMMSGDEAMLRPKPGFEVLFMQFLYRGLALPAHEFMPGILFVYGVHLHQLTPNSILHIACFIMLCECFLGIEPHWGLWRRLFLLRRNVSRSAIHEVGGDIISTRAEANYFDLRLHNSIQDWRKKLFYVRGEAAADQKYGLAPYDSTTEVQKLKNGTFPRRMPSSKKSSP